MVGKYGMSAALAGLLCLPLSSTAVTLSGRVVDSQNQRSYGEARISSGTKVASTSDDQGFFHLDDVKPGPLLLSVELADGESFRVRLKVPPGKAFFVELDRARHTPPVEDDDY